MKNQNDLIVMIAAGVVALGVILWSAFSARTPVAPAKPEAVPLGNVALPAGQVTKATSLPGGNNQAGGGGAAPAAVGGGAPPAGGAAPGGQQPKNRPSVATSSS